MKDFFTVQNLKVNYQTARGTVRAVNGISFDAFGNEILCIVGETGSGKTSAMLSFMQLLPAPAGKVTSGRASFLGRDLLTVPAEEMRRVRSVQIPMIYQNPALLFPSAAPVESIMIDPLVNFQGVDKAGAHQRILETLNHQGAHETGDFFERTPAQLSRGMLQQAMIARALSCRPQMVIGDEPFTGMDVIAQTLVMDIIKKTAKELGTAFIIICQNMAVVARLATRVIVMYAGAIMEDAPVDRFFSNPQHPYSLGLLGSYPGIRTCRHEIVPAIRGTAPSPTAEIVGCPFLSRCNFAVDRCKVENPTLLTVENGHRSACWVDPQAGRIR
jgi:oligopeptide transport system ATP-binding protein